MASITAPYAVLALFALLGVAYVAGALVVSRLVAPRSADTARKSQPVECGVEPVGDARIQFKVGYYLFALVFVVFDVEALFLFPAVKLLAERGGGLPLALVLAELLVFLLVVGLALVFAWRKKVLTWQ